MPAFIHRQAKLLAEAIDREAEAWAYGEIERLSAAYEAVRVDGRML